MRAQIGHSPLLAGALAVALGFAGPARADLKAAMAEPDLEKRSGLALDNAFDALKAARKAYAKDDAGQVAALAGEIGDSVDLAQTSLEQTGENPRRHPKWFKKAEIATRDLLRRLDTFQQEMNYVDRPLLDKLKAHILTVHDELLLGLMEGRPK